MFNVNIYENKCSGEVVSGRSECIPNQALSIREIIRRSNRGQILSEVQGNNLQYGDDEDPDGEDLFDPSDDKFDVRDKLSYYEQRIAQAKAAQEYAKKQKEKKQSEEDEHSGSDKDSSKDSD